MINNDTICAVATGKTNGAISLIRVSGNDTFKIIDKIFKAKSNKQIVNQKTQTIHFGNIYDENKLIDEVLISIFKSPNSYTGEDLVEISCHGSVYIQQCVLQLLVKSGAKIAQPGEFTLRAYQNGKLDLSQAEAVADLIASNNKLSHQVAINQMRGGVSNKLKELRQELLHFISLIELELDFSEEDVEFAEREKLKTLVSDINNIMMKLIKSFEVGNAIKKGIPVAIVGEPNVGKSTLLNAILDDEKAIVSDIPGTTRDVVEDVINISGVDYRFFDTAGLRQTDDRIESLGIERTYKKIEQANIILALFNSTDSKTKIEQGINNIFKNIDDNQKVILVLNKSDLTKHTFHYENAKLFGTIEISAKHNKNIEGLLKMLENIFSFNDINNDEVIISNARHYDALQNAQNAINRTLEGLNSNVSGDFLAMDIREAIFYLAGITGDEITTDEILGNIFSHFCIGK